jgi:RNA polymerase sigma-70 factor (ECF subfamily)
MPPRNLSRPLPVGPSEDPTDDWARHALEDRILAHAPRLRAFLRKLSGSAQDTEDLVQETLTRGLRYQGSFDSEGSLTGWLMKTAFRCYLDLRERRRREPAQLGDAAELVTATDRSPVEARDLVSHLLRRLSPIEQDIVLRFHHRQETLVEIGAALGMPVNTVKSHLHRARRNLAEGGDA